MNNEIENHIRKSKIIFKNYCINRKYKYKNILPKVKIGNKNEAILIEFRQLESLKFIITNAIYRLGNEWSFTVVCGINNFEFIKKIGEEFNINLRIIKLEKYNITRMEYSVMLLDKNFWNKFHGENLIIYQEDTIIFKKLSNKFLKYDYIGSPFPNGRVGNGGLSFRKKKFMREICEKYFNPIFSKMEKNLEFYENTKKKLEIKGINYLKDSKFYFLYLIEKNLLEDLLISNIIYEKKKYKIPNFKTALEFSVEKHYHNNPFGGHQFWYCVKNIEKWLDKNLK
jgi:hypothetical protein